MSFTLDTRLGNDCFPIHENDSRILLLLNNAHYCWFVIVPKVDVCEWYELEKEQQLAINDEVNRLSQWLKQQQGAEKINIATIGNIVRQMHIHVLGRKSSDPAWPGVVWGHGERTSYEENDVNTLRYLLCETLNLK